MRQHVGSSKIAAFSLVELSIVLVILGLLVGGVLSGQSLIRGAEVSSSIAEYQRHVSSIYTFRDKYFALPGDMNNATAFWGIAAGTGADDTCRTFSSTDAKTCNGDGDGFVNGTTTGAAGATYNERLRFWQHLANAGLIEGSYSGAWPNPVAPAHVPGVTSPKSKIGSTGMWITSYNAPSAGTATNFASSGGNIIRITGAAYTTQECWNVDTKLDDGLPGTGRMIAYKGDASSPVTTAANVVPPGDAGAIYDFTQTARICNPWMFY